ncbi:MAG: ATP-binding protein [Clostridia bacterium]|nr:ATP-binding protein [Clostridia bacterium]
MLLEFSCANHKSIREKVLFSTLAGKDTTLEDQTHELGGIKVLKTSVIYGANGSGKSNFIDAVSFVKNLVMNSITLQPGQGVRQSPHRLDGFDRESSYKIQFITKGVRYVFGFSVRNMLISEEYLFFFPNNRQTRIYERSGEDFTAGSKFKGKLSSCKDMLRPNRLLLSCAANFSSVQEIADAYSFFCHELVIYGPEIQDDWMQYSLYQINSHPNMKAAFTTFLQELGTGIKDILISIDQKKVNSAELPPFLSNESHSIIWHGPVDSLTAVVRYEGFDMDLLHEESSGIKKLFSLFCPFIDMMANGKVLICDDLDSSLHESLVYGLLKLFMNTKADVFSQFIFTTHETALLSLDLFRRDQIWFMELKESDHSTDLYSLSEIRNVRKEENFEKGYISGKYGAIPTLNLNFANFASYL